MINMSTQRYKQIWIKQQEPNIIKELKYES